jgi:hypothetical protein
VNTKDVLLLLFERGNAIRAFWGFYIAVAFGIVGFFGQTPRSCVVALLGTIVFIVFAVAKCRGMYAIAKQRVLFFDLVNRIENSNDAEAPSSLPPEVRERLLEAIHPPSPRAVLIFQIVVDLGLVVTIWLLTLLPHK